MRISGLFSVALMAATVAAAAAAAEMDSKTAEICAEAEARYVELFGKASSEEPVTVVLMYKYTFCPPDIAVKAGTTLRWVNVDKRTSHSVQVPDTGEPESDRLFSEEAFEMTFEKPGEYGYICVPHWESYDMIGSITVEP